MWYQSVCYVECVDYEDNVGLVDWVVQCILNVDGERGNLTDGTGRPEKTWWTGRYYCVKEDMKVFWLI